MNENIFQIARQQVDLVKSVLGKRFAFEDNSTNEVQSGYTTYGTLETPTALIVVRLSNHICSMNNWTTRYKPKLIANSKLARRMGNNLQLPYKERCFFSIVFKAFDYTPNDVGNWKAICREYVFNPLEIEKSGTIGNISKDCLKLNSNEIISINGQNPIDRIAKKANTTENNQIKKNRNMNKKQVVKINEQQLRKIVAESCRRVLQENETSEDEMDERGVGTYMKAAGNALGGFFNKKNKGGRLQAAVDAGRNTIKYADTKELINKIKEYINLYNQQIDQQYQKNGWNPKYAEKYKIKSTTTVGKLLGLKDNKGNKPMGMMTSDALATNRKIRNAGGNYEE